MKDALIVIPARHNSSRFPGKVLAPLCGKPVLQWVWEAARQAQAGETVVATDDLRIQSVVEGFGGKVVWTSEDCPSGTDRVWQAANPMPFEIVVNLQADEPLLAPATIARVVECLKEDPGILMATAAAPRSPHDVWEDPHLVKVRVNESGLAETFVRRLPAPESDGAGSWLKHLGIYAYRKPFLAKFTGLARTAGEIAENLEQLRALEHGTPIRVVEVDDPTVAVDTPEDLRRAEAVMAERTTGNAGNLGSRAGRWNG